MSKLDRPDREKIKRIINPYCAALYPDGCKSDGVNLSCQECNKMADQIIALFPDIEEAKKQERVEIGLQIQQQWSKVTSAKGYSPYKLVDFLGGIITKLNKGQTLKEEK